MADPYRQNKSRVYSVDTPHSAIDNLIAKNTLSNFLSTTGGKNIFGQEVAPLTEDELLMMIMPMAGSIRGGKSAISTLQQLKGIAKKHGIKVPRKLQPQTIEDYMTTNKINAARMKNQQVLNKYGIEDPDKIFRGFGQN